MKTLELTPAQKGKIITASVLLNQIIEEIKDKPFKGPSAEQFRVLQDSATGVELIALGNCLAKQPAKKGK